MPGKVNGRWYCCLPWGGFWWAMPALAYPATGAAEFKVSGPLPGELNAHRISVLTPGMPMVLSV